MILTLKFVTDRHLLSQQQLTAATLAGLTRDCLPAVIAFITSQPAPAAAQPSLLLVSACDLVLSILALSPSVLPPELAALCSSLSLSFSSSRPLLASTLAAIAALPASVLASSSPPLLSALWQRCLSTPAGGTRGSAALITRAVEAMSSLRAPEREEQRSEGDSAVLLLTAAASLSPLSQQERREVWGKPEAPHVAALLATATRSRQQRPIRRLLLHLLQLCIDDAEDPGSPPAAAVTAPSEAAEPLTTTAGAADGGARCLALCSELLSSRFPLPSSVVSCLAQTLLSRPALCSSVIPRLLGSDFLTSPSTVLSCNTASLLSRLCSQQHFGAELRSQLLSVYVVSPIDVSPLLLRLPLHLSLPAAVRLLSEKEEAGDETAVSALRSLLVQLLESGDTVSALTAVIDAFTAAPAHWPENGNPRAVVARPAQSLSPAAAARLLSLVERGLSLTAFTHPLQSASAVTRLLEYLFSSPSSTLHLSIVTRLQRTVQRSVVAQDAVVAACIQQLDRGLQLEHSGHDALYDSESAAAVSSSLLFTQLFPILVLRSLSSHLFIVRSELGRAQQRRLFPLLLQLMRSSDSAQLKMVAAEVQARLDPGVLFASLCPALASALVASALGDAAVCAFIVCSAFAFYTALSQADSEEKLQDRQKLFAFEVEAVSTVCCDPSSHQSKVSKQDAGVALEAAVPALVQELLGSLLRQPDDGRPQTADSERLQRGCVEALCNLLIASASHQLRAGSGVSSLLTAFLAPFAVTESEAEHGAEEQKEPRRQRVAAQSSQAVRLCLLSLLCFACNRIASTLKQQMDSEAKLEPSQLQHLASLQRGLTSACLSSALHFLPFSSSMTEEAAVLSLVFTAAYHLPALVQQQASELLTLALRCIAVRGRVQEVHESEGKQQEEGEEEAAASLKGRTFAALKLLGCIFAHAASAVMAEDGAAFVRVCHALQTVVAAGDDAAGPQSVQLARHLLQLIGMTE